jgi:hypothetical protein
MLILRQSAEAPLAFMKMNRPIYASKDECSEPGSDGVAWSSWRQEGKGEGQQWSLGSELRKLFHMKQLLKNTKIYRTSSR